MQALNDFFKNLAEKLTFLPDFFSETSLLFNNLFLVLVAVVSLVGLLLVAFLMRSKKA